MVIDKPRLPGVLGAGEDFTQCMALPEGGQSMRATWS
jgi:hypothetical protein